MKVPGETYTSIAGKKFAKVDLNRTSRHKEDSDGDLETSPCPNAVVAAVTSANGVTEAIAAYNKFLTRCFPGYYDLHSSLIRSLDFVVGVIRTTNDDDVWCMATRIAESKGRTARHCFFEMDGHQRYRTKDGATFTLLGDPDHPYTIGALHQTSRYKGDIVPTHQREDYLEFDILPRPDAISHPTPIVKERQAKVGDRLVLPEFDPTYAGLIDKHWQRAIRVDITSSCQVGAVADNCVYHGCQSDAHASGSGIFAIDGDELRLVAVHIGAAGDITEYSDKSDSCVNFPKDRGGSPLGNQGIAPVISVH